MGRVQITFRELLPDEGVCALAHRELAALAGDDELAACHAVVHRVALPKHGIALVHVTVGLFVAGRERSGDAIASSATEAFRIAFRAAGTDVAGERSAPRLRRARTGTSRLARHRLHAW